MAEKINVIGGGLAGSLLSICMAKRGFEVNLFERRPDMRKNRISAGKSINLALSTRGLKALEQVGLDKEIMKEAIPMYGRTIHSRTGEINYQPYGKEGQAINSVSRGLLNIQLLELADAYENITLHFNAKCVGVDIEQGLATFEMDGGAKKTFQSDRIVGTDGAFAATRARMQSTDRFNYSQSYLPVGYKELIIPPGDGAKFMMEKKALHIWPRGTFMMIALPNPPGDYTCTLFMPFEGEKSFSKLQTEADVKQFFDEEFPDAVPMMPSLLKDFFTNPTSSLVTVRCYPWSIGGKLTLAGDAAHAVVPFFGQGMNCSFEDVMVLDSCIDSYYPDWNKAFDEYQKQRKPNADAIADLAIANYTEMAEKVGDKVFLHKKQIEHELCELYPDEFKSQYELVTFSTVPYKQAKERGLMNDLILAYIIDNKLEDQLGNRELILPVIKNNGLM